MTRREFTVDGCAAWVEWSDVEPFHFTPDVDDPDEGWVAGVEVLVDMSHAIACTVEVTGPDRRVFYARAQVSRELCEYPDIERLVERGALEGCLERMGYPVVDIIRLGDEFVDG